MPDNDQTPQDDQQVDNSAAAAGTDGAAGAGEQGAKGPENALAAIEQELGYTEQPKPEADGAAPKLDADGKPIGEAKPALGKDGKPLVGAAAASAAAAAAKTAEGKPGDKSALYKMPDGLSHEATRRFQTLVGDNKKLTGELEALRAETSRHAEVTETVKGFNQVFEDAKVQPQQFSLAIEFIKAVNHGNFDAAAKIVTEQTRMLSLAMGRPIGEADPLAGFPDLQAEIAENKLTQARAMEIARARTVAKAQLTQNQQQQRSQEDVRAWNASVTKAGIAVDAWVQKKAQGIDWPAKEKLFLERVDWLAQHVHPSLWVSMLEQYDEILSKGGAATAAQVQQQQHQPLRSNGGAGQAKAQPRTALEAQDMALGYATQG